MKLGMFDPPELQPYTSIPSDVVNCPEHQVHCTFSNIIIIIIIYYYLLLY